MPKNVFDKRDTIKLNAGFAAASARAGAGRDPIPNHLFVPGTAGGEASTPDSAALSIVGDIDIRAWVQLSTVNPIDANFIIAKEGGAGNRTYEFLLDTDGTLALRWSEDGTAQILSRSTIAVTFAGGVSRWIRATLDVDNGAAGNDVAFYTSLNGSTWIQLGTTVTTATATSIFDSEATLFIGQQSSGDAGTKSAKIFRAQVYDGIGGTLVYDADFTRVPAGATSFTEHSSTAATVTINSPARVVLGY